ncbi:hypothetical protein N0V93_005032 [Gnomoniopsis smithogilvyi]|uniref:Pentatricopeptide repeat protein n=1 Tax=Gnomoniopsis smithogilvyi TaxID=1191159 RepID=A0A9W9CXN4_9PEZI|nr:hypothetical protein N0V93_005032 [Gnomoniopsis smithogilvyi]
MFVCRACTKRASINLLRRLPADGRQAVASRTFATSPISRQIPSSDLQNLSSDWGELDAVAEKEEPKRKESANHQDRAAERQKALEKLKRATKKELQYTTDPYHIAENVAKKLEEKDFEKALILTREASKDKQVVVSWNHLIAHELKNQKLHAAIKLYNEMKKRAQLPNAQTYTIIFRGCAESKHPLSAVNEAFKIYNAMLASSRLKPNQIHLNSMLELCARAQDIETLFMVLRSANGQRAPNNLTYTIILNALRYQRSNQINPNEDEKEQKTAVDASIATTISRSKLVWDEVITRWKKGEIVMDEELMCAMGRVLLLGGAAETDSVLSMVGEVLGIANLRDGEPGFVDPGAQKAARSKISNKSAEPQQPKRIERAEQFEESDKGEDFDSSQPKDTGHTAPSPPPKASTPTGPMAIAKMAGNNTLSLVMRTLAQAKRTKLAARYWDYLLQTHNIVPDRRNYRDYIDCLSTGAASGKAARVLVSMPNTIADGNLYRRGLLLCHWDAFNEKSFENATLIHNAMVKKLRVPDTRCMKLYLQLAMTSYRKFDDKGKYPNPWDGKKAHAVQMSTALDHVWEPMRRVTGDLDYSGTAMTSATPEEAWQRLHPRRLEIIEVARKFVATSDKILSQGLIAKGDNDFQLTVNRRRIMQAFIDKWLTRNDQYAGRGMRRQKEGETREDDENVFATAGSN